LNPVSASWSSVGQPDSGIQNAQYFWRSFAPTIIASGNADQGARLELAMWKALFDSTDHGTLGGTSFSVTTWASAGAQTAYDTYLAALSFDAVNGHQSDGNILRDALYASSEGTQFMPGAGQDLMFNTTPVPEPTTIVAGAMLLLPFGAGTLRILRKRRTA
jgi:hypothetical protein